MNSVDVQHVAKSFGAVKAVVDASLSAQPGDILGLLGPNGAGKTTTIRMILDIFRPDAGQITVFGGPMSEEKKNRIGYMPEERGLYQDIPLEQCLVYLATLKGLSAAEARRRLAEQLEHFDLAAHKGKKVKELSKGMQQKAQIISTIVHGPELIIIDEPFAALDPVNTQVVKDLLRSLRDDGASIIMCTHQMHQVEELCDRIVLIDKGRDVLRGSLAEIRRQYAGHAVVVSAQGPLPTLPGVAAVETHNHSSRLTLDESTTPQEILRGLLDQGVALERFEIATPSLDEIFIQVVGAGGE
ncbi:MAG: ATP-binding cassette domain-containing protein [Chloroflexi bacterium]|nr:ATP-binding cassette domain-containing protein [Chloroflexota bacterium]